MAETNHVPRQPNTGGGCGIGCVLPALATLFLATVLIAVALLLPPFNLLDQLLGPNFVPLDATNNAAQSQDQNVTLIVDPADVRIEYGVAIGAVPLETFLSGDVSAGDWVPAALANAPATLALQSDVYVIETTGSAPSSVTLSVNLPDVVGSADLVDLYRYDDLAREWRFLPAQPGPDGASLVANVERAPGQLALFQAATPTQPTVLASVDVTQVLAEDVASVATIVSPAGLQPTLEGTLAGSLAAGFSNNAGYLVMPVIRNFTDPRALDTNTVTTILGNGELRSNHATQVAAFASAYDGVFIDYRDVPVDQRQNFTLLVQELGATLDTLGIAFGVVVPAAQPVAGEWDTGAYDWRAIGEAVDYLHVDVKGVDPTMFAPGEDRLVEAMLRWAVGEVNRYKMLLGLSSQSARQAQDTGEFVSIGYEEALSALGDVRIEVDQLTVEGSVLPGAEIRASLDGLRAESSFDESAQTSYIDYLDENENLVTRVWLTNSEALRYRMDRTLPFAVGGVAFNDLLAADLADGALNAIVSYKLQVPATATEREQLALRWRIESAEDVIGEVETGLNESLIATLDAPEGNYAINVAVVDEGETIRSGVAVALANPTATPTPLPSATPSPVPTSTPTPDPEAIAAAQVQATQVALNIASAGSGGGGSAVQPGPGRIRAGNFEYGGHVTSTGSSRASNAMRRAGMTWMKVQIRYTLGGGTGDAQAAIEGARANGFKILIGTVGAPNELDAFGSQYISGYASWLGEIAALGPDAIEVWNEPNIDREWPRGRISGEAYATMLRAGYNAIKSRNPGVLVISGAPAPTGAEAAFPGQVVNDDRFIRELVAAGGLQSMDCLGAHYNEGIVPPSARSGDPRDNYYTRYLGGMIDTYWSITGGQVPICFTELGYLTSAGYPSLPPFFAWASNVTLGQQAAWLAEAAAYSSQSGRVRMMIVWNVDFTVYGADPQGGYAMIRPDGSCPACDAMAAAR